MSREFIALFGTPRRRAAVGLFLAMLLVGGVGTKLGVSHLEPQQASSAAPLALRFTPNSVLSYRVAWSGKQRGRLFQGSGEQTHVTTQVDMSLDMELFVEDVRDGEASLVLSITGVDHHAFDVFGSEVFPTQEAAVATLVGKHARVRIGSDGRAHDVSFEEGSEGTFANIVQWIVRESSVSLDGSQRGATWESEEPGPFGKSHVRYSRDVDGIARTRLSYSEFDAFATANVAALRAKSLRGTTNIRIHERGVLDSVRSEETIQVEGSDGGAELAGNARFDLQLMKFGFRSSPLAAIQYTDAVAAAEPVVGEEVRAQLLEQRIAGLTAEQLLGDLTAFGNGGVLPEHTRWMWRATGLLRKEPKLAADLAKVALRPGANDKTRALVLDLLASVGHPDAQAAMRTVLTSPALAEAGLRPVLLQRASLLDAPEPATVDMLWDSYRDGKKKGWSDLTYASAHALAAASGSATDQGDAQRARDLVRSLSDEIRSAQTPEARAQLLGSLANTKDPQTASVATAYATSEDANTREAAADAVRNVPTREATDMLIALLADGNRQVQAASLASLAQRTLGESEWTRIGAVVAAGRLDVALSGALLNLASNYVGQYASVAQTIAQVAANENASTATRARARAILEQAAT